MRNFSIVALAVLMLNSATWALESKDDTVSLEPIRKKIEASLQIARPSFVVEKVQPSGVGNLYEVYLGGGMMLYATEDGSHIIQGKVFRVDGNGFVDVREEKLQPLRAEVLANVPLNDMIIFSPKGETKAVVTVFTDVDCGYCQKLHNNMAAYNAMGIEVRYMGFPRAGHDSSSEKKLVSAWCADDRKAALTNLKRRLPIPENLCDSPVPAQYKLGERLGVNGTPALFRIDGSLIPGYREPEQLAQDLGL